MVIFWTAAADGGPRSCERSYGAESGTGFVTWGPGDEQDAILFHFLLVFLSPHRGGGFFEITRLFDRGRGPAILGTPFLIPL